MHLTKKTTNDIDTNEVAIIFRLSLEQIL